jgi:hypothetical protein
VPPDEERARASIAAASREFGSRVIFSLRAMLALIRLIVRRRDDDE